MMGYSIGSRVIGSLALVAVMTAPVGAFAQAKAMSDAQVEANVLKAFAGDQRLANQAINTSTVFGTVTLTGSVTDEAARDAAEQIASRTDGVKKVVDQMSVGAAPAQASAQADPNNDPAAQNSMPGSAMPAYQGSAAAAANAQQGDPNSGNVPPQYSQQQQPQQQYGAPQGYPQQQGQYPQQQGQYPQQQGQYPQQGQAQPAYGDPQAQQDPQQRPRLYYRDYQRQQQGGQQGYAQQGPPQGQPGGQLVTVPDGTILNVAINRWITSGDAQPGSTFTALVGQDVLAGGQIAIPRGATVDGTVLDAKGAGVLKGRGSLTLQLNTLELGGQRIPLQSEPFTVTGKDKSVRSVNSTIIGAGLGALFGAAIGGGTGAAIGAGVGGAAGLGSAAASGGGNVNLPPEAMLHFRITQPLPVTTVSEAEMQRLGGYAGPARGYRQGGPPPQGYAPGGPVVGVGIGVAPYPYYRRGYYRGGYWY
jgi:hypothetical protein